MKECIKVGLLGAGTVGSGVLTVLEENTAEIEKKVGVPIHVSKILVRDMKKAKELSEKYKIFIDYLYPSYFFSKCNEYIILISSLLVFCTITISCRSNLRWYVANR